MQYVEDEELETTNEECVLTADNFKSLAKNFLNVFFKDVSTKENKKFSAAQLHTDRNISMVLNLSIRNGMDLIYDAMKPSAIKNDISFVVAELLRCSRLGVPKCFATGMVGVYLELCVGCELDFEE